MDAIELARQTAQKLHEQAIDDDGDPCQPYDFVLAEAERHELDVEKTGVGSSLLNGSRAVFRHKKRLIVHEDQGSPFEQAFLVAHELGHFILGDHSDGAGPCSIEPDRSAEPSRTGMARVADYGPKQRREIQMDLFAREFLLPRSLVRRLHLDEGLTASQIADQYGAPFEVVAQQLIDALLPPMPAPETEEQVAHKLNDEQQEAVKHRGGPFLLEAGPGTGKTQTLTARIESLLAEKVDPQNILVLTFSNKAASEMAGRIAQKNKEAAVSMFIGTFHAFGLELLHQLFDEFKLPKAFPLLERAEAVELLLDEFPRLGLKLYRNLYDPTYTIDEMLSAILRAKDELVDENDYQIYADKLAERAETEEERKAAGQAKEIAKFYRRYEALKRETNSVDFGDLLLLPTRLLKQNASIRQQLSAKYQHILVDEYQDVNRSSVELLTALRPDGQNLWVVGDARQSIYRFRGASSANMAYFGKKDFVGGIRRQLRVNYRSHSEIVKAFSAFSARMQLSKDRQRVTQESVFEAVRGPNGMIPEHRPLASSQQLSAAIADGIEEMQAAGFRFHEQAILCTSNDKLADLARELEHLDIPVLFLGSLFERPEIKDLLSLLSLLVDSWGLGLVRVACLSEFRMPLEDVALLLGHIRQAEGSFLKRLHACKAVTGLSDEARQACERLAETLKDLDSQASPWRVLSLLLFDRTRMAARFVGSESLSERSSCLAVWQFMNFVRAQTVQTGWPMRELLERVRRMVRYQDDHELRQLPAAAQGIDAVRLMTIHKAKGLQFPVVHLSEVNYDNLPRLWRDRHACPPLEIVIHSDFQRVKKLLKERHDEEQECLFYVALSRARSKIFLYSPTQRHDRRKWGVSHFVRWMDKTVCSNPQHKTQRSPVILPENALRLLNVEQKFEASQLSLYASCPRQFYYSHILRIGGKRNSNAYLKMHEAVRTVLASVVSQPDLKLSDEELQNQIAEACESLGLLEHGYAADYQAAAFMMLKFYLKTRQDFTYEDPALLSVSSENDEIFVRPDEVLILDNGRRRLRRIRTGQRRFDKALKGMEAAALVSAARKAYEDAEVEWIHLANEEKQIVSFFDDEIKKQLKKLHENLKSIRAGHFPARPENTKRCSGCQAFFICGPLPEDRAEKDFLPDFTG